MKLEQKHIALIGVGVSAIGVVGMLLYYRHMQSVAASNASVANSSGSAYPYPYSPQVTLPSDYGGSVPNTGAIATTSSASGSGSALSPDLVSLLNNAITQNTATTNNQISATLFSQLASASTSNDAAAGLGAPSYIAGSYSDVNNQPTFGFWTGPAQPGTAPAAAPVNPAQTTTGSTTNTNPAVSGTIGNVAPQPVTQRNPSGAGGVGGGGVSSGSTGVAGDAGAGSGAG